jgi:hypothetical protein
MTTPAPCIVLKHFIFRVAASGIPKPLVFEGDNPERR